MTREESIELLLLTFRERRASSTWVENQLQRYVTEGNQEGMGVYCMSLARKLLDGSLTEGSLHGAIVVFWKELGGQAPVRPFPQHGPPVMG